MPDSPNAEILPEIPAVRQFREIKHRHYSTLFWPA